MDQVKVDEVGKIDFLGLEFKGLTKNILFEETSSLKIIVTVNSEFVVLAHNDENFRGIICENYATFDGQVPFLLAKFKFPNVVIEKISGSDFIYDVCEFSKKNNKKVFLLGGYLSSNELAVEELKKKFGIEVNGFSPEFQSYPFSQSHNQLILDRIELFKPHYLFVGFGAKKQELWINENKFFLESLGVELAVGVGGTFEFVSNLIKRAPKFIQYIGLEGIYRLMMEPSLLRMRRLVISLKVFKYYFIK
jgi:N-acetylglucosaminyldiphosphoundecaprenol N-acetyl-beta-D-mannosaminyltransferase